jgi:hypothetical protein
MLGLALALEPPSKTLDLDSFVGLVQKQPMSILIWHYPDSVSLLEIPGSVFLSTRICLLTADISSNQMSTPYPYFQASDLHCAVCRTHISLFISNVCYPACRHVFCSACFHRNQDLQFGRFVCPLDCGSWQPVAENNEQFLCLLSGWWGGFTQCCWTPQDENAFQTLRKAFTALAPYINFALFPCAHPTTPHPDFDFCPYDHSVRSEIAGKEVTVTVFYCRKCKINVKNSTCPRCSEQSELRTMKGMRAIHHRKHRSGEIMKKRTEGWDAGLTH